MQKKNYLFQFFFAYFRFFTRFRLIGGPKKKSDAPFREGPGLKSRQTLSPKVPRSYSLPKLERDLTLYYFDQKA